MSDYGTRDGFILYKDDSGATWRVGQYTRGLIYDNKVQKNQDEQASLDIFLILDLPHAIRAKYMATVVGLLAGEHFFYMTFGNGHERRFCFKIRESHIFTVPQTIAAILG